MMQCNGMMSFLMQNITLAGWTIAWNGMGASVVGEPGATSSHGACNRLVRNPVLPHIW
jgi:hypothetical protein